MIHVIEKIEKGKFKIQWENRPDSLIMLDFNPLLNHYKLQNGLGVIEHWQAKPINLRRWGLYDILSDTYYSCDADKILFSPNLKIASLQIPEFDHPNIKPTAVKLYGKAIVRVLDVDRYYVGSDLDAIS